MDEWRISEARKRELRFQREHFPGTLWTLPEYNECIRRGLHFDTVIGFVPQRGGAMQTVATLTARETEQVTAANRAAHVPSFNELWERGLPTYSVSKTKSYVRGRDLAWKNHASMNAIGQMPVNHVTEDMAIAFIDSVGLAADGKGKLLQMFRWLSKRAIRDGHLRRCPFDGVKIKDRSTADKIKFWHPANEYPLILEHARDDDAREYFGFSMGCGPRPSEAKNFEWPDVDMDGETLTFRYGGGEDRATKTGEVKTVSMVAEAKQWLESRIDRLHRGVKPEAGLIFPNPQNGEAFGRNHDFGLKQTLRDAGIEGKGRGLYAFRHAFCVALANEFFGDHWSRDDAREMMRHGATQTIDAYYRVLKPRLAEKASQSKPLTNIGDFQGSRRTKAPEPSLANEYAALSRSPGRARIYGHETIPK